MNKRITLVLLFSMGLFLTFSQEVNLNDGPYIFIEGEQLSSMSIVDGKSG